MKQNDIKIVKSPLRYPGSKQKFCDFFLTILNNNSVLPDLFIEPFAGGSSISLFLLQNNFVKQIALIEKDPLVASFWKTVFFDAEWFIKEINKLEVTLENWNYFKTYNPKTTRTKAIKCLFQNRTGFSGILKAGPIGGQKQTSKYKIDCRFNKKELINRINILSLYKDRVLFIEEGDYERVLQENKKFFPCNTLIYFDPPYVNKAKDLYNFYFKWEDHIRLKDFIKNLEYNWLLSYDYEPPINQLYQEFSYSGFFDITYTTASDTHRTKKKEFVASNLKLF